MVIGAKLPPKLWLSNEVVNQEVIIKIDHSNARLSRSSQSHIHGIMALILFVGYAILCIHNIRTTDETRKINIPWILAIGILVQFAWEFVLLVTGIRNPSFMTIVVNSLLETNLGLPYMYLIHRAVSKRYHENLSRSEKIIVA